MIGLLVAGGRPGGGPAPRGDLPFHLRVPRLTDVAPPISLPLLLAWIPVPLGVAAIAIVDQQLAPLALPLDGEQTLIVGIALLTLIGGALAAFISDDIRHATGYLVIADGALVLLGFAALDPAALGPDAGVARGARGVEDGGRRLGGGDGGPVRDARDPGPPGLAPPLADPRRGADGRGGRDATGCPGWVAFEARADLAELSGSGIAWLDRARRRGDAADLRAAARDRDRTGHESGARRGARAGAHPPAPGDAAGGGRGSGIRSGGRDHDGARHGGRSGADTGAAAGVAAMTGSAPTHATGHSPTALARAGVARTRAEASAIEASLAGARRRRCGATGRSCLAATVLALAVLAALRRGARWTSAAPRARPRRSRRRRVRLTRRPVRAAAGEVYSPGASTQRSISRS